MTQACKEPPKLIFNNRHQSVDERHFHVLKTLGGCGGTIVSRYLASAGSLVLSEVNPRSACLFGGGLNPLEQLRRHGLPLPEGWLHVDGHVLGDPTAFGRFIADLTDMTEQSILIRDYSYIEYVGVPFVWPIPTAPSLTQALRPYGRTHAAMLVRHPADCYKSLLSHPPLYRLSPEVFIRGHLAMYDDNPSSVRVCFEDFLENPSSTLNVLCEAMAISPAASWSAVLPETLRLTGHKRALESTKIENVERKVRNAIGRRLGSCARLRSSADVRQI